MHHVFSKPSSEPHCECCTESEVRTSKSFKVRSLLLFLLAIVSMLSDILPWSWLGPWVMHFSFYIIVAFFVISSFLIIWSIKEDFKEPVFLVFALFLMVSLSLSLPFIVYKPLADFLLGLSLVLFVSVLFINYDGQHVRLAFPPVRRVILFLVILNWQMSLISLLPMQLSIYPFVLHDALLILAISNVALWVQNITKSQFLQKEKRDLTIQIQGRNASIYDLKKDDQFNVIEGKTADGIALPVDSIVRQEAQCFDDPSAQWKTRNAGTVVPKNTMVSSGSFCAQQAYSEQEDNLVEPDQRLSFFLMGSFLLASIAGIAHGWLSASILVGMQYFCLNLIVACPCVFLVSKPILNHKFKACESTKHFSVREIPSQGRPDFIVFDRTFTLVNTHSQRDEQGYWALSSSTLNLFRSLKKQGIEIFIISGVKDRSYYEACKAQLKGLIDEDNIRFSINDDEDYTQSKERVILNLQRYGRLEPSGNFWLRCGCRLKSLLKSYVVVMVGDGANDLDAMKKADWSICVGHSQQLAHGVDHIAHFNASSPDKLSYLDTLINVLEIKQRYIMLLIGLACLYNLSLLVLVNGLFGWVLPPTLACAATSLGCIVFALAAHWMPISDKQPELQQGAAHAFPAKQPDGEPSSTPACCKSGACSKGQQTDERRPSTFPPAETFHAPPPPPCCKGGACRKKRPTFKKYAVYSDVSLLPAVP